MKNGVDRPVELRYGTCHSKRCRKMYPRPTRRCQCR